MVIQLDYRVFNKLSSGYELDTISSIFNSFVFELAEYLKFQPLYQNITISLSDGENQRENLSILDFGVKREVNNQKLTITFELNEESQRFLPFILLREAYYSFIPENANNLVKICINQFIENDLSDSVYLKEWKKLIKDSLVDRYFIHSQLDRLKKFFKLETKEFLENPVQFFFREIRENVLLCHYNDSETFYDVIWEKYSYKTSRSLFYPDIVETLWALIHLFYKNKSYAHISDYKNLFRQFKEEGLIDTSLSLRKFIENVQWINKCSSIAPSYDFNLGSLRLCALHLIIRFNPLLEKDKVRKVIEGWSFYHSLKFSVNSFATEVSVYFNLPKVYLQDFKNYLNRLQESGYIIYKHLSLALHKTTLLNLNYYTDISNTNIIIDPNNTNYKKKYEIEFTIQHQGPFSPLSLLGFVLLNRVRKVSVSGLTFDKRVETLNAIKEDIDNQLRKHTKLTEDFKNSFSNLIKYQNDFLEFLNINEKYGLLHIYSQLTNILNYIDLINVFLNEHSGISNIYQLQNFINEKATSKIIEEQLLIRDETFKNIIFRDFLPLYFHSKKAYKKEVEKIRVFLNVCKACYNLKILNITSLKKLVEEPNLAKDIYEKREQKYKDLFRPLSLYKIKNEKIESTIEAFLSHDPPVIQPLLIGTILASPFAKYYLTLILKNNNETQEELKKLKVYFPKIFINESTNLDTKTNHLAIDIYFLNIKEKRQFFSILHSYFQDSIILIKHYFWRGVQRRNINEELIEFYEFEKMRFFYSKNIFEQILKYSEKIFGEKLEFPEYPIGDKTSTLFWSKTHGMDNLAKNVKNRVFRQNINFDLKYVNALQKFRNELKNNLIDQDTFKEIKTKNFFKRYIDSIRFLPAFRKFGLSKYSLYFRPLRYTQVDFKILLQSTFQGIKYPACIEPDLPLFCQYLFPFRNPNKSYLNWLVSSKKNVSEYCLFYIKRIYDILHFNHNLTKEGWNYSSLRFKSFMQDVLFNPTYKPQLSEIRKFNLDEISQSGMFGPDSNEFKTLTQVYSTQSIDIKSYIWTGKKVKHSQTLELLKHGLVFPFLDIKNLGFQDKISIILPDIKQELNDKILQIFTFFNRCKIYEIEGEFFIYGFEKEKTFENGLLIEIWFPKCELDEFLSVFDLLFQYLEIKHYIILTDLVNGKTLLKSVYGNLDFLKEYNPLLNLKWNDKDKIWMNHKFFTEKFESIYPRLIPES